MSLKRGQRGSPPAGERERGSKIPARLEVLPLRLANLELWPDYQVFVSGEVST